MHPVLEKIYKIGIIPVIAFNGAEEALPLCRALTAGGLPAAEVTFRTDCAEECIKLIHKEMPEMLLGAGTVTTKDQAERAIKAGAQFIVSPGYDPAVVEYVQAAGGVALPGTMTPGEMQQAMNQGCEVIKYFPAEANGGVAMLKNIGAALKGAKWMCTGGINAQNVREYLSYDQVAAVGGTWMCKSDLIKTHEWEKITALCREAVDAMLDLKLGHLGINCPDDTASRQTAQLLCSMLHMQSAEQHNSFFVGKREFEIMKAPGRGTNGHIAIKCSNTERAIYHLEQRGIRFDPSSAKVENGRRHFIYMEGEVAGFAIHLVER